MNLLLSTLLRHHLRFDAADPNWPDRDRLVIAPGATTSAEAASRLLGAGLGLFHAPGQPLAAATGLAVAERLLAARFGRSLVDHRSWLVCGAAELETGSAREAAALAGHLRLGRLTVLAAMAPADAHGLAALSASGWSVRRVEAAADGQLRAAISAAQRSFKPTLIAWLDGPDPQEPATDPAVWAAAGRGGAGSRRAWLKRLARHAGRQEFEHGVAGRLPAGWHAALARPTWLAAPIPGLSTLHASRRALTDILPVIPGVVPVSSFDATPQAVGPTDPILPGEAGRGAPATLAGLALHGAILPVTVHTLAKADRLRPALTEAAMAGTRLVALLVEQRDPCPVAGQRAGLRAMRNLAVFRPADASEAVECLELALRRVAGPSVLLVSDLPVALLSDHPTRTRATRGGYLVLEPPARAATLIASGPDLHVALAAARLVATAGIATAVVSLPCWTLFAAQDAAWQSHVLGTAPRIAVEAGSGFGWERWLGPRGLFVSLAPTPGAPGPDGADAAARLVADAVLRLGLRTA